jgi:hypothetical protein
MAVYGATRTRQLRPEPLRARRRAVVRKLDRFHYQVLEHKAIRCERPADFFLSRP